MNVKRVVIVVEHEDREWSRTGSEDKTTWAESVNGLQYQKIGEADWQHTYDGGLSWLNCTDTPIIEKEYLRKINESA
jgi:hypothetical protein